MRRMGRGATQAPIKPSMLPPPPARVVTDAVGGVVKDLRDVLDGGGSRSGGTPLPQRRRRWWQSLGRHSPSSET